MTEPKIKRLGQARRQQVGFNKYGIEDTLTAETENVKVTYADGTVFYQKVQLVRNKGRFGVKEHNKLYLDAACTILATVTRKEKLKETKHLLKKG
ncbi:hypothetical protein [Priestia megaterium]|uniref:hypothetical protein n=1 Tax=Priestia megaterium TaxID=1404 RepID=UPI0015AB636A|nr:hypothetical protein [Priestia megaterium]QLC85416.1 hypothetical protein HW576_02300 [Priestia megaterium]